MTLIALGIQRIICVGWGGPHGVFCHAQFQQQAVDTKVLLGAGTSKTSSAGHATCLLAKFSISRAPGHKH